jgi:hypothetical protein
MPDEQARRIRFTFHPSHPSPESFDAPYLQTKSEALPTEPIFFPADGGNGWIIRSATRFFRNRQIYVYHLPPQKNKKAWFDALSYDISPHQSIILFI